MKRFAKEIGAMRGDRPDWYAVAEHLAEIAKPELLKTPPGGKKRGGKHGIDWTMLFFDVDLVKRQKGCTIDRACKHLVNGYLPHCSTVPLADGTKVVVRAASQNWKGKKQGTLRQRYYDSLKQNRAQLRRLAGK